MSGIFIPFAFVTGFLLGYGFSVARRRWHRYRQRRNFKPRLIRPYSARSFPVTIDTPKRAVNE